MSSPIFSQRVPSGFTPLIVTSECLDDQTRLVLAIGEIDLVTAPILIDELSMVLRPPMPKIVLVDLSGVTFLSSTGIGVLIDARRRGRAADVRVRICGPNRAVARVLQLTGVMDYLEVFDSRMAARLTSSPVGLPR